MKENQKAKLYLIPTPIGNFDDISIRVINVLKEVDIIFCEDTRTTSILLSKLNIKKKLIASHKYNESKNINKILKYLSENLVVGIVSDRGTPVISDPGYILTKNVIENGYEVVAIPGPTAFVPALIASGINPHHFLFYGFLDSKRSQRKKELENLKLERHTIIFYEAPHRLNETINDMKMILGNNRKVSISREISKKYERTYHGKLFDILDKIDETRGEFVIVVAGNNSVDTSINIPIIEHIKIYENQNISTMDAIKQVAKDRYMKKNEVYKEYLKEKEK